MAFKYTGDSILGVSLTVLTPKPLDTRTVVAYTEDLYNIDPKYAYEGMLVANVDNGNTYMLVDKSNIDNASGWKASYESILILTCTEEEYKEWQANTTEDFKPVDSSKPYLHLETYYYIYEDSLDENLFYLSAEWGKKIEEQLKQKALNTTVSLIRIDLDNTIASLSDYATLEELTSNYVSNDSLATSLTNYYTRKETDDIFVTKESLRGEGMEGDDFVFVTKREYEEDLQSIQDLLDKTLKVDGNGSLESITVGQIKSPVVEGEDLLVIDVRSEGLFIGEDLIATESDIPNLVTLTEEEYLKLVEEGTIEPDTYYYVYDTTNDAKVYITKEYLDLNYHTTNLYQSWVSLNYYNREYIDSNLFLSADIENYYTKEESDSKYLTIEYSEGTYSKKEELELLEKDIASNYVTKEDLRGDSVEGDDFVFVTQNKYNQDRANDSSKFNTEELSTDKVVIKDKITLDASETHLFANNKKIPYSSEIPKLECMTLDNYEDLLELNRIMQDTYYFTYDGEDPGIVTRLLLEANYYSRELVNQIILDIYTNLGLEPPPILM